MANSKGKGGTVAKGRRSKLKKEFCPDEITWDGPDEMGYFCTPRTFPYISCVLRQKNISANIDPTSVLLELYSRHMGEGIIEMSHEDDHANASGYFGSRASRSWRDRMKILEDAGFIKAIEKGSRKYGYVVLVHPSIAMKKLYDKGLILDSLWNAYRSRQIESSEYKAEDLLESDE